MCQEWELRKFLSQTKGGKVNDKDSSDIRLDIGSDRCRSNVAARRRDEHGREQF